MQFQCGKCNTTLRIDETKWNQSEVLVACPVCGIKNKLKLPTRPASAVGSSVDNVDPTWFARGHIRSQQNIAASNVHNSEVTWREVNKNPLAYGGWSKGAFYSMLIISSLIPIVGIITGIVGLSSSTLGKQKQGMQILIGSVGIIFFYIIRAMLK